MALKTDSWLKEMSTNTGLPVHGFDIPVLFQVEVL